MVRSGVATEPMVCQEQVPICRTNEEPETELPSLRTEEASELITQVGGRLAMFYEQWQKITSDPFVLQSVQGYKIPFTRTVTQISKPKVKFASLKEQNDCEEAINQLLKKGAIEKCNPCSGQFISSYFLTPKSDGSKRFILNLKKLNEFIKVEHFKMEDIRTASKLVSKNSYMIVFDLQDAYLTVPIYKKHRKYLRFEFKGNTYEFLVLPFGLCTAPYVYTKISKPVLRKLRKLGFLVVGYIDDFLLIAQSRAIYIEIFEIIRKIFCNLGFLINYKKSTLEPSKQVDFLGFTIDSESLVLKITQKRQTQLSGLLKSFIEKKECTIEQFASLIGSLVATCLASTYGWLYTKTMEREKILALQSNSNNYNATMVLSDLSRSDLQWWQSNIHKNYKALHSTTTYQMTIFTDASRSGWGAFDGNKRAWGPWESSDNNNSINYLELLAIKYALTSLSYNKININILLRVDNTKAIAYFSKMDRIR